MCARMDRTGWSATRAIMFALALGAAFCTTYIARPVFAQSREPTSFLVQQRFLEEQIRPLIQPELLSAPVEDRFQYDFGAILRYNAMWYEDHGPDVPFPFPGINDFQGSRAAHDFDFRPW